MTSPAATAALTTAPSVVRALLQGEIIIDIRPATAPVPAVGDRLWLVPTADDAALKPAYRLVRELSERPPAGVPPAPPPTGEVEGWAELVGVGRATLNETRLGDLGGKTIVDLGALAGMDVVVLALRAHRLAAPIGSGDLPADPGSSASVPALSNVAFEAKTQSVADSLPLGLEKK